MGDDLTLGKIAGVAGLSQFHFARVFRRTTGLGIAISVRDLRDNSRKARNVIQTILDSNGKFL